MTELVRSETRPLIEWRRAILAFEEGLRQLPPHECPVDHFFTEGVYVRRMFIAAGVALVGHIHRYPCLNVVQGDIVVATETGTRRITGHELFASPEGVKRAGWAQADTLWTTIHANADNERDIATLEARLIVPLSPEYLELAVPALETKP